MNLKKIIVVLVTGIIFTTTYATSTNIIDMPSDWSKDAVSRAIEERILARLDK